MNRALCLQLLLALACLAAAGALLLGCGDDDDDDSATGGDDDVADDDAADDDATDDDDNDDAGDDDDDDNDADDDATDDDDNDADDDNDDDDNTPDHGQANLIKNGGFETGDSTNWIGEWPYDALVWSEGADDDTGDDDTEWNIVAHGGTYAAYFGQEQLGAETAWAGQTVQIPDALTSGTIAFWLYLYRFLEDEGSFTAKLVDAANPGTVLLDLGEWTPDDSALLPSYKLISHDLTADEMNALGGQQATLRFDYNCTHSFMTAFYIYLDDVSFPVEW